jgi:hypothetical protein
MDRLDAFAIRLVEELAPDEVDSAPAYARAAAANDDSHLSYKTGQVFGGFDALTLAAEAGETLGQLLTWLFIVIKANIPVLSSACTVGAASVKVVAYVRQKGGFPSMKELTAKPPIPAKPMPDTPVPPDLVGMDSVVKTVMDCHSALANGFQSRGLNATVAGSIACSIIEKLVTEPDGGKAVLARLGHGA